MVQMFPVSKLIMWKVLDFNITNFGSFPESFQSIPSPDTNAFIAGRLSSLLESLSHKPFTFYARLSLLCGKAANRYWTFGSFAMV